MARLILLRHGQSLWNAQDLFTGWVDVPLSPKGIEEAFSAGERLSHVPIDAVYSSSLIRAIMTAFLALSRHVGGKTPLLLRTAGEKKEWTRCYDEEYSFLPVLCAEELNERMYGELQGKNKERTRETYGEEQVRLWRRSYTLAPPGGESLQMTAERVLPYFSRHIHPSLEEGKDTLVVAHGNSLRSIVMTIEELTADDIISREIPTGEPLFYTYRAGTYTLEK